MYGEAFYADLKKHTLQRFLHLVAFLDQAKCSELLPMEPCLFQIEQEAMRTEGSCKDTTVFKSSKDILCRFAREFMSGEGDVIRHLSGLGYKVEAGQSFLDEFDYKVVWDRDVKYPFQ